MYEKDQTPHLAHREAVGAADLMTAFVKFYGLSPGLNTHRIFETWDKISGLGSCTLNRFFKNGTLYITVSSSMIRNQLGFQKAGLIRAMNDMLAKDPLFQKDCRQVGYIKNIIFK